jgi:hypothetical protein
MSHRQSLPARRPLVRSLHFLAIIALLAVARGTVAEEPRPGSAVSPEGLLNPDGTLDLTTGFQGTLDLCGWEVALDGERGPVLEPASVSAASTTCWGALPNGSLNNAVRALVVAGSDLYVGGEFSQTGDGAVTGLGNIARYDTAAGTWHALPNQGLNDVVYALAVVGDDLYAGGEFSQTGDGTTLTDLGHIARYDTVADEWHTLANKGLDGWAIFALAVVGSDLYVGGQFSQTGDGTTLTNLGRIARYDTVAGTWHALPNQGLSSIVWALAVMGSDLYVGGDFVQTGDGTTLTNLGRIARYDTAGGAWYALPKEGLNDSVFGLAVLGSDLYVGGRFTATGDGTVTSLGNIAHYDTTGATWYPLPNGGLNDRVWALAVLGDDLYVGGTFGETGDGTTLTDLGRIARYDLTSGTWHALPNEGLGSWVEALAVLGNDLYVGGSFTQAGDGTLTSLDYIARYIPCPHQVYLPLVVRQ